MDEELAIAESAPFRHASFRRSAVEATGPLGPSQSRQSHRLPVAAFNSII